MLEEGRTADTEADTQQINRDIVVEEVYHGINLRSVHTTISTVLLNLGLRQVSKALSQQTSVHLHIQMLNP